MNKIPGRYKNRFSFSKSNALNRQYLVFVFKLLLLNIPLFIAFTLLRSNPAVQVAVSESFPAYHLAKLIMSSTQGLLSIFGYQASLVYDTAIYYYGVFSLQIPGGVQTFIAFSCLGMGVSWVFATLIISSQGRALAKTIYILAGIIIIFILNVFRMTYLTWSGRNGDLFTNNTISFFGLGTLNHHDLFNIFIYIVIILLFILWTEVYSQKKSH
jgi:exosortase/archaeosortase family protein